MKLKSPPLKTLEDDGGNQKARYHKEDVYAHKAAAQPGREGVKYHNRKYRQRSQAVDVTPISRVGVIFWE